MVPSSQMKVLSFAVFFPHHCAEIKEEGYISLKLRVVALNDLNGKCFLPLRNETLGVEQEAGSVWEIHIPHEQSFLRLTLVPVPLEMTFWGFSGINTMENRSRISSISIAECNFTSLLKSF